jgi:hypothetical protein
VEKCGPKNGGKRRCPHQKDEHSGPLGRQSKGRRGESSVYLPNIRTQQQQARSKSEERKGISSPLQFSAKLLLGWHSTPRSLLQTSPHWGIRENTPAQSIIPTNNTLREGVSHKKKRKEKEVERSECNI